MRIALILVFVAAVLVGGCRRDAADPAVTDTTMVDLLVELHLANGRIEVTDQPLLLDRDSIFAAYGVDSTSYAEALEYYAQHPEEYSRMYGRVLDRLSAERVPLDLRPSSDTTQGRLSERAELPDSPLEDPD